MKTEREMLRAIAKTARALALPAAADARRKLVTNARAKPWKARSVAGLQGMVWHQELGWGSVEAVAEYHTGKESHLARGGVRSIAYTFAIRRNGQIVLCNDFDRAVWSQGYGGRAGDENAELVAVMFEGFFTGPGVTDPSVGEPNEAQLLAGLALWRTCRDEWSWGAGDLYGHFHFGKPACPGDTLRAVIEAVRANREESRYDFATVAGRQQALHDLGYSPGRVDGLWGPRSRGALIRFQPDHGLAADGIWGLATEAALSGALRA
jgi:hypothetical protein